MTTYVIRRLLLVVPTLLILTVLVFMLVRFLPGNIIDMMESDLDALDWELDREGFLRLMGLDVPFYVQYARWMGGMFLHGTLGDSLFAGHTVEEKILAALPVTIQLGAMSFVLAQLIALPVGIYSAIRQDTPADYVARTIAIIGMATPNFWLALMVMIYPTIWWGWAPPIEYIPFTENPLGSIGMPHHSIRDCGHGHVRGHDAVDAHHDAGGAQARLCQDGQVEGSQGEGGHL